MCAQSWFMPIMLVCLYVILPLHSSTIGCYTRLLYLVFNSHDKFFGEGAHFSYVFVQNIE